MNRLKYNEEDLLTVIYNILVCMESETDDINRYLKKTNTPKDIIPNELFRCLDNAIEHFTKIHK